jgi:hypothetical protein
VKVACLSRQALDHQSSLLVHSGILNRVVAGCFTHDEILNSIIKRLLVEPKASMHLFLDENDLPIAYILY